MRNRMNICELCGHDSSEDGVLASREQEDGEGAENPDEGYEYGLEIASDDHERKLDAMQAERQIKSMVDRFLGWKLPENFSPDGGISFQKTANENTSHERKNEPTGTNLFDALQAEEMVRYMLAAHPPIPTAEPPALAAKEPK